MTNYTTRTIGIILLVLLLAVLISALAQPTYGGSSSATPTARPTLPGAYLDYLPLVSVNYSPLPTPTMTATPRPTPTSEGWRPTPTP